MKIRVKGTKIILSETPVRDVVGAFFLIFNRKIKVAKPKFKEMKPKIYTGKIDAPVLRKNIKVEKTTIEDVTLDVKRGQKEYDLPEGVAKKDIEALYLRVL